jgi:uncharacterized membrane protein (DUF4010 family)
VGPDRAAAGIRTYAVAALTGVVAMLLGGVWLIAVVVLAVSALTWLSYRRSTSQDPGLTSEIALILTCLLGGYAVRDAVLAAAVGAALAGLLAARERIHHIVHGLLSERELNDGILFAAVCLIALPLAPDRFMGPFNALNPHALVGIIVLVMAVSALGYVALRVVGARQGLPLAGFLSGFISSTATIHAMGRRTKTEAALMPGLIAGAVLSSLATIVQMAVMLLFIAPDLLAALLPALVAAGVAAALYAFYFTIKALRQTDKNYASQGHAFDLKAAFIFAALIAAVITISAALNFWLGDNGVLIAAFVTGLADGHAPAVAASSLLRAAQISTDAAAIAVLLGLSANALTKVIVAYTAGGRDYALRIAPGLLLMTAAAWIGAMI